MLGGGIRLSSGAVNDLQVTTLWDAFAQMKFDAATLGSGDLPDLAALPAGAKAMLICGNVTYQNGPDNGKPIAQPVLYKTVKTAAGKSVVVAIIGLLGDDPYLAIPTPSNSPPDKPWKVSDPSTALKAVLPEARKKAGVVIVLYSGTREPARKIMTENPGVDVMVVGLEGSVDHRAEPVGTGVLVQNAERGRYGGQLGIALGEDGHPKKFDASTFANTYDLRSITIDDGFKDDPDMVTVVKAFHEKQTKILPSPTPYVQGAPVAKSEWAGSYMCASCHSAEFDQWRTTKHFIAMNTLEKTDGGQPSKRADCVSCHVVGYDKPGGYSLAQPRWDLKGVGCESCHGPAEAHVEAQLHKTADTSKMIAHPDKAVCTSCHTKDNSPSFNFVTYKAKIVHKKIGSAKTIAKPTPKPAPKPAATPAGLGGVE